MDEIVLDKKTFEALAMDSRVKIMKALKERRKTQAELSKELSLAPSTISEHLEKMVEATLIARKKDHHKWIYYELTEKGRHILAPEKASVFVFALSLTLVVAVFAYLFLTFMTGSLSAASAPASYEGQKALGAAPPMSDLIQKQDYTLIIVIVVAAVLVSLFFLYKRFKK